MCGHLLKVSRRAASLYIKARSTTPLGVVVSESDFGSRHCNLEKADLRYGEYFGIVLYSIADVPFNYFKWCPSFRIFKHMGNLYTLYLITSVL